MTKALFIGRFQPFHSGHLKDVKDILKDNDKVIIAIGSAEKKGTPDNPFTSDQRKQMILNTLEDAGIKKDKYELHTVTDIGDNDLWVSHVEKNIPKFDIVYTGNSLVRELFEKAGYKVIKLILYKDITSTTIRRRISQGLNWKEMVPNTVAYYLEDIDAEKIIKDSEATNKHQQSSQNSTEEAH